MGYLVTGGTGFVGAHVVRALLQDAEQVIAYDIIPDQNLLEKLMGKEMCNRVTVVRGDITDLAHLIHTCREHNVETVIHTAATLSSDNPYLTLRVNCEGTVNVLEAGRILGMKRVVLTSSISVYGPQDKYEEEFISNDAPHYPHSLYSASKSLNETYASHYFREYGLDTITIRLAHVYGLGRSRGLGRLVDDELFVKPALGKPGKVPYSDSTHNYMYIEDAARVLVMASRVRKTKTRAFTAGGDSISTAELAAYIRSLIPGADITLLPGHLAWAHRFDSTPLREEVGFTPEWTIQEGVMKYIEQIRADNQATGK